MAPRLLRILLALWMVAAPFTGSVEAEERSPRVNYMLNCQGCHLPNGSGMAGKVPSMRGSLGNFLRVDGGREFIVRVPGTANSKLNDQEIASLLNWLVPEMGPPLANFVPFSASEVHELRAHRLQDVATLRATLMQEVGKLTPVLPAGANQ